MDTSPSSAQKKGLGTPAKIGIGCGAVVILAIIGVVVTAVMFGGKLKQFTEEAKKNPTRATATTMVSASFGHLEMVAEDDANKRYTVKDKKSGALTTVYWNEKKQAAEVVNGDFSAIPTDAPAAEAAPAGGTAPATDPAPDEEEN